MGLREEGVLVPLPVRRYVQVRRLTLQTPCTLSYASCVNCSISLDELMDGEEIATCPSCTLTIRVVYDIDKLTAANKKAHAPKSSSAHNFMEDVYKSVDKSAIRGYEKGESKSGESKESSDYQSKDGSSSDYQCKDGSRKDEY